jgi:hypothetical protein
MASPVESGDEQADTQVSAAIGFSRSSSIRLYESQ